MPNALTLQMVINSMMRETRQKPTVFEKSPTAIVS